VKFVNVLTALAVALLFIPLVTSAEQYRFDPGCTLPYEAIKQAQPIDSECNQAGESEEYAPNNQVQRRSNEVKNQLCAPGPPVLLSFKDFERLQGRVEDAGIEFGPSKHTKDRSALRTLYPTTVNGEAVTVGEGSLVRVVAYVAEAKTSNVSYGESVNCKRKGKPNNDIHITLVRRLGDPPCSGLVAEIIPHFRPRAWRDTAIRAITRPVRVTGHLFFDSPHLPCNEEGHAVGGNPARVSLWEIHPVYAFEVCTHATLATRRGDHDEDWTPRGAPEP
jgi:hypothetical protein